jgi:flagellar biosynthetic protein FlhB
VAEQPEAEDRTEDPSARRLEKAREEGNVAVSPEVTSFAVLGAAALVLSLLAPDIGRMLVGRMALLLEQGHALDPVGALQAALVLSALASAPLVLAALVASAATTLAQTRLLFYAKAAAPDFTRLSPLKGLKRMFGWAALGLVAKSVVKVAVVGAAAWMVLESALPALERSADWDAGALAAKSVALVLRVMLAMLVAQALIAVADLLFTRIRHWRSLRMSRQDQRDEVKEQEGDPYVKARLRAIRMQRARRRMLASVPKATVVITNPTHYAVALAYARDSDAAPRIVAKGVDAMAARIREVATQNGVPLVANPPLARALYPHELDRPIPAEFFQPVAEIIAYVWKLRGRA